MGEFDVELGMSLRTVVGPFVRVVVTVMEVATVGWLAMNRYKIVCRYACYVREDVLD
jgi:hypothetical protein